MLAIQSPGAEFELYEAIDSSSFYNQSNKSNTRD